MKFKKEWMKQRWFENLSIVLIGILFFVILENFGMFFDWIGKILKFLSPVIVGAAIAYVIDPLARLFEHHLFWRLSWRFRFFFSLSWQKVSSSS